MDIDTIKNKYILKQIVNDFRYKHNCISISIFCDINRENKLLYLSQGIDNINIISTKCISNNKAYIVPDKFMLNRNNITLDLF